MFPQHQTHKLGTVHCLATEVTVGIDFSAIQDIEFLMSLIYYYSITLRYSLILQFLLFKIILILLY